MNSILEIMKIICFLSLHTADSNPEVCKGAQGVVECCPGFVWNKIENRCTRYQTSKKKCEPGYIGPNCEYVCPYPMYGNNCISECHCSEDNCSPAYGCLKWSDGATRLSQKSQILRSTTVSLTTSVNEVTLLTNTKESTCKRKRNGNENAVLNIFIVGLSAIVVILCAIYIGSSLKSHILKSSNCMSA